MGKGKRNPIQVNNISDLRRHALNTLNMLIEGDIEVEDAKVASDLYGNVLGILKAEVDHNKMVGKIAPLPFYESTESEQPALSAKTIEALENKSTTRWE